MKAELSRMGDAGRTSSNKAFLESHIYSGLYGDSFVYHVLSACYHFATTLSRPKLIQHALDSYPLRVSSC